MTLHAFANVRSTTTRPGEAPWRVVAPTIVIAVATAMLTGCSGRSPASTSAPALADDPVALAANRVVDEASRQGFMGVVLVRRGDRILIHRADGYSDQAGAVPMQLDTRVMTASVTKAFTAALVMLMMEDGKLRTDSTLGDLLAGVPPDKASITVHQLLTHTSGLPNEYAAEGIAERDRAMAAVLALPLANPPGATFLYSNDGYDLLAMIVEGVASEPYDDLLRRRIFKPAGMKGAVLWAQGLRLEPPARAEFNSDLPAGVSDSNWGYRGSAGVWSSAADLDRWCDALFGGRILTRRSLDQVLSTQVSHSGGRGYGYGWLTFTDSDRSRSLVSRGNEDYGPSAAILVRPDRDTRIIVVARGQTANETPWAREVAERIDAAIR